MTPPFSRVHRDMALRPGTAALGSNPWRNIRRIRVQIGGAIVIAVLFPALVRWLLMDKHLLFVLNSSLGYAALGTLGSLLAGQVLLRQLLAFPGVKATTYILPSFVASYASAAVIFFFFRIDYSRWQFAASFLLVVGWFVFIYWLMRKYAQPRLALVPGGDERNITSLAGAEWVRLR